MTNSAPQGITNEAIARILGIPLLTAERWAHGEEGMFLTPTQTLFLCESLGISLKQLADLYISWAK
jgi:hypothetical protein